MKTSIRAAGIKSISNNRGGLCASEIHGKRLDDVSQKRIIGAPKSINWSKAGEGKGLDLVEAFKAHKKETGAVERGKSEIGTHLLVVVPPEWIKEGGDIHDPNNPNTLKAIEEAKKWAESWQGEGSVFAYRFDLDEKGTGVIDLFTAPIFEQGRRNGKTVKTISPNMAKEKLVKETGEKTSGAAFQTSWAKWAKRNLDSRMERGNRKDETNRDHVHAEVYAKEAEKAKKEIEKELQDAHDTIMMAQMIEQKLTKREQAIEKNEAKKLSLFNKSKVIQDKLKELENLKEVYDKKYHNMVAKLEADIKKKELDLSIRRSNILMEQKLHEEKLKKAELFLAKTENLQIIEKQNSVLRAALSEEKQSRIKEVSALTLKLEEAETEIDELKEDRKITDFIISFLKQHLPDILEKIINIWNKKHENELEEDNDYESPSM